MNKVNKLLIWFIAAVLISTFILIIFWYSSSNQEDVETVAIIKEENKKYEATLVASYEEYQDILNEYEVLGKLSFKDFEEHDYILDFIEYSSKTKIEGIDIVISQNITLTYKLVDAEGSQSEILLNLIPIAKNVVSKNNQIKHEIK